MAGMDGGCSPARAPPPRRRNLCRIIAQTGKKSTQALQARLSEKGGRGQDWPPPENGWQGTSKCGTAIVVLPTPGRRNHLAVHESWL